MFSCVKEMRVCFSVCVFDRESVCSCLCVRESEIVCGCVSE